MHPIREILINEGYRLTEKGDFWRTSARYRGGDNETSLSIHKKTGWFHDFVTGDKGPPEKLVSIINGQSVKFDKIYQAPEAEKIKVTKYYPDSILETFLPDYKLFLDRGISLATLKLFGAGLCHYGKLRNRICFPIYAQNGKIMGFQGRWFYEKTPEKTIPKWKNIGDKKDWLYPCTLNKDIIQSCGEIILVESIGNLIALWEAGYKNAICIFGTSISSKQFNYILGLNPQKIYISTDNDEIECKGPEAAEKIKAKLTKFFDESKIIIALPPKKDFGVMSTPEIQNFWKNTR